MPRLDRVAVVCAALSLCCAAPASAAEDALGSRFVWTPTEPEDGRTTFAINPDGTGLIGLGALVASEPAVLSPDGRRIAFPTYALRGADGTHDGSTRGALAVANVDGTSLRILVANTGENATVGRGLTWSPDGERVAYNDFAGAIRVVNVAGGTPALLVSGADQQTPGQVFAVNGELSWSPDGTRIAFAGREAKSGGGSSTDTIYTVPAAGGPPQALLPSDPDAFRYGPDWSPDGSQLAYGYERLSEGSGGYRELRVVSPDGSSSRTLVRRDQAPGEEDPPVLDTPRFAPDGTRVAVDFGCPFGECTGDRQYRIFPLDGGSASSLTINGSAADWGVLRSPVPSGRVTVAPQRLLSDPVQVRRRKGRKFSAIREPTVLKPPVELIVDDMATINATGPGGRLLQATVESSRFTTTVKGGLVDLKLSQPLPCAKNKKAKRFFDASAPKGFRSTARAAQVTPTGDARWLVEDTCTGTTVSAGANSAPLVVRDLVKRKNVTLKPGKRYTARLAKPK